MSKERQNILHPDIAYLMDPKITEVVGQGLAVLYEEKPGDPVDYLAKWLLKHSQTEVERAHVFDSRHFCS